MSAARLRYGPGIIRQTPRGTFAAFVSLGHGQCRRRVLKTLAEAKAWVVAAAQSGNAATLDTAQAADAQAALAILPDGITLSEAARYWKRCHPDARAAVTLPEAWEIYEAAMAANLRPRTLQSYRAAWARLAASMPESATVSAIDEGRISRIIDAAPSAIARNGLLRALSAVCGHLAAQHYLAANPCADIRPSRVDKGVPVAFSVPDVRSALDLAARRFPAAVPALALGFFAGLRPAEALRIRPAEALRNGYIRLTPAMTKTADARSVAIRPNLAAWLKAFPVPRGGLSERAVKAFRAAWKRSRKGRDWPHDVCRHSYATYAYEATRDAAAVAAEMGHVGTDVFFRHYRAMARPGDGARFFSILPPHR